MAVDQSQTLIKCASPQMGEQEVRAVAEVIRSGQLCSGPRVREFEEGFGKWQFNRGAPWVHRNGKVDNPEQYCVAVNSGTAALHLALLSAGVGPGDEVITTPLTFGATATAVLMCGARVVFADVDDNLQMSWEDAYNRITERTKAIIPVHYLGAACWDVKYETFIREIVEGDFAIIEDCAQAHGSTYRGQKVGLLGDMACYSFFATKALSTGEGGMIVMNGHQSLRREWMVAARAQGLTNRWNHAFLGYNYRMTEIAAAIGLVQLEKLDIMTAARVAVSERLLDGIQDLSWLSTPERTAGHTYFWCPVIVDEQQIGLSTQSLVEHLRKSGVEVRYRYPVPLYKLPVFLERNNPQPAELPNAEKYAGKFIGLPNRPDMHEWEIERVLEVLHEVRP